MNEHRQSAYREYAPPPDLARFVACTWSQQLASASAGSLAIIPDGCVDIIVCGDELPHVAGPATRTQLVAPASQSIHGLRLRPGAAPAVLHCSMALVLDSEASLPDLCGREARTFVQSDDAAEIRAALTQWVRARLQKSKQSPAARAAACAITRTPGISLNVLLQQLDLSARQLHRELTAACGYGPKLLQRIMRVQHTIRAAATGQLRLAELAGMTGYADQAHMTRDFRQLTGQTPARYFASCNMDVGRWLDEP